LNSTALQIGDKHRVTTPVNWKKGEDVIVHPGVTNEEAKTLFPDFTIHKVRFELCCRLLRRVIYIGFEAIPEDYAAQGVDNDIRSSHICKSVLYANKYSVLWE
jgi:hypothetical protein